MLRRWLVSREIPDSSSAKWELAAEEQTVVSELEAIMDPAIGHCEPAPEVKDVLDQSAVQELYEIMEDEFIELLESYLNGAPGLMRDLERAVAAEDAQGIVSPAHSLKSSSANVGAMQFSALAKQLELMGRQNELVDLGQKFGKAKQAFDRAADAIRAICERGAP
jgi:HPt (histidine-containing phosphotransfer) domain-containing protein